jgi:hypothetical protein
MMGRLGYWETHSFGETAFSLNNANDRILDADSGSCAKSVNGAQGF